MRFIILLALLGCGCSQAPVPLITPTPIPTSRATPEASAEFTQIHEHFHNRMVPAFCELYKSGAHYLRADVPVAERQKVVPQLLTAFDEGDRNSNLESLESSQLASLKRLFPGKQANPGFSNGEPFAYPNPYYAGASWEGASDFEEDRKLVFANLPPHCMIRVYTVAGDMVDEFEHNDADYSGGDVRWFETYSDPTQTQFSGGEHAWDLLSKDNQIIARGIYLFSVEDLDGGDIKQGKFVVIK